MKRQDKNALLMCLEAHLCLLCSYDGSAEIYTLLYVRVDVRHESDKRVDLQRLAHLLGTCLFLTTSRVVATAIMRI